MAAPRTTRQASTVRAIINGTHRGTKNLTRSARVAAANGLINRSERAGSLKGRELTNARRAHTAAARRTSGT